MYLPRYSLHAVASDLGMASLAQQCLIRLSTETEDMINTSISHGANLGQVLDLNVKANVDRPSQPLLPRNMVQVVFSHVLEDDTSPKRLVELVVTRLAEHLDVDLWEKLACRVTHPISLLIINAMIQSRQIKTEGSLSLGAE